jgi:hypothetical protein
MLDAVDNTALGSTSTEAPGSITRPRTVPCTKAATLKLEVRRQAKLYRRKRRESGSTQGARVVGRLQKSERRIFLDAVVERGATRATLWRRDSAQRATSL